MRLEALRTERSVGILLKEYSSVLSHGWERAEVAVSLLMGSGCKSPRIMDLASLEMVLHSVSGKTTLEVNIFSQYSFSSFAGHGSFPAIIAKRITPQAQMSTAKEYGFPLITSGA
mmetsp:Transcript_48/g.86  ORF Transcript_48/g.86 Transcript_48/m.86 type:complete len:115 (+) Transcript_48:4221-4565(+)